MVPAVMHSGVFCGRRRLFPKGVLVLSLATLAWVGNVSAAAFGDPTEAPQVWVDAQSKAVGGASVTEIPSGQVIVVGRTRKLAVVEGETVKVGDMYRGSKVAAIRTDKIVMEDSTKTIAVTPGVEKKILVSGKKKRVAKHAGGPASKSIGSNQ